jgi:hypothetical protein
VKKKKTLPKNIIMAKDGEYYAPFDPTPFNEKYYNTNSAMAGTASNASTANWAQQIMKAGAAGATVSFNGDAVLAHDDPPGTEGKGLAEIIEENTK